MRQTLLLAGRPVRPPNPSCQDASLIPLLLLSIWLLLHTRVTPTCPSLFVCLSSELSTVGPNHTTICPLPGFCPLRHGSSECYSTVPQQNYWNPGALAHSSIVSETWGGKVWRTLYCKRDSLPGSPEGLRENRMLGQRACCRNTENTCSRHNHFYRTELQSSLLVGTFFFYIVLLIGTTFISFSLLRLIYFGFSFVFVICPVIYFYCSCTNV